MRTLEDLEERIGEIKKVHEKKMESDLYQEFVDFVDDPNTPDISYDYYLGWFAGLKWVLEGEAERDSEVLRSEQEVEEELEEMKKSYIDNFEKCSEWLDDLIEPVSGHIFDYYDGYREALVWSKGKEI